MWRAGIRGARGERRRCEWARGRSGAAAFRKGARLDARATQPRGYRLLAERQQAWAEFSRHCLAAEATEALRDFWLSSRPQEMRLLVLLGPRKNDPTTIPMQKR